MANTIHRLADFGPACGEPNVWDDLSITWSNVTCPACQAFNPDATGLDKAFQIVVTESPGGDAYAGSYDGPYPPPPAPGFTRDF